VAYAPFGRLATPIKYYVRSKIIMKIIATLKTESKDAESVASALDIDNVKLEKLRVETKSERDKILTRIEADSINTLINTLDDIIRCQIVAEKIIT